MTPSISKKRKVQDSTERRPKKKFKKQLEYHSSSEEEGDSVADLAPVNQEGLKSAVNDATEENGRCGAAVDIEPTTREEGKETDGSTTDSSDEGDGEDHDSSSEAVSDSGDYSNGGDAESDAPSKALDNHQKDIPKRRDPSAFATSISKILSTKLPTSARADPVLSRSKAAAQTTLNVAHEKLERQARAKLRGERKEELDRGRIRDVLGIDRNEAGQTAAEEKRLRKIAQRGVIKLFNAVRAAQVRGEEAAREERRKGTIGVEERKKTVDGVSKQSFLELINGKHGRNLKIEEA